MGRSRYKIYEPTHPHFITCTVLNWIPKSFDKTTTKRKCKDNTRSAHLLQKAHKTLHYSYVLSSAVFYGFILVEFMRKELGYAFPSGTMGTRVT